MTDIIQEIAAKSASLPSELQLEVLDFVDFVSGKRRQNGNRFESVRGILNRDLSNLEIDVVEVRREMWGGFPREGAK